jgi:hypothetical protein
VGFEGTFGIPIVTLITATGTYRPTNWKLYACGAS